MPNSKFFSQQSRTPKYQTWRGRLGFEKQNIVPESAQSYFIIPCIHPMIMPTNRAGPTAPSSVYHI